MFVRNIILNHSYLLSFSLSLVAPLGCSTAPRLLENAKGTCRGYGRTKSFWEGIFCTNFSQSRGHWRACQGTWCGKCYKAPGCEDHRVVHPQDEEGFDLTLEEDRERHMFARNGDHLLIPFQFKLCHYRNLKGIDLTGAKAERILLMTIRRANLDVFWSREPGTMSATRRDSLNLARIGMRVGLENFLPVMGPFMLEDSLGMGLAVRILVRSLDKGRYQSTL